MDLEQLRSEVAAGEVETVLLAIADMEGRLQGKRLTATHFLNEILENGAEGCSYLLTVDTEMETVGGYEMSSWEKGYGDFVMKPDLSTLRAIPWHEKTVLLMADCGWHDGKPVVASPRQILRRQLERLEERGLIANAATELEFIVFRNTYEDAWKRDFRGLDPANLYNVDYSLLGTARIEPLIRRIRNEMEAAGMEVENSKGECNLGQHEINFRYEDALTTADQHVIFKTGTKEIASQEECSITFMAKWDEREGSSCHIHLSLAGTDGKNAFAADQEMFEHFVAGQLQYLRELTLFYAPNINSYKRFAEGSFAPTSVTWGKDNRTCSFRVVGHGEGLRVENRLPGADVNPYLAISAMIAAGLDGVDSKLPLQASCDGNAYTAGAERVPSNIYTARDLFRDSKLANQAFGEEVVRHYVHRAEFEIETFEATVTDWERRRGFERH
ncbi:MAG: glutamine synthetase family protein [Solirubrobacterales bacterium]